MRGEKERSNQKKYAVVAKFFCGYAYSTDLIDHLDIFAARLNREEKSDAVDVFAAQINNREEKKDKTVSFQSTNKESMVPQSRKHNLTAH